MPSDSELSGSYMGREPGSTMRPRGLRRASRFATVGAILAVGVASPWWFGWLTSGSSGSFSSFSGRIPTPTGIYAPTALDEARASHVEAIAGPGYHIVQVSRVFVSGRVPAYPGAPVSSLPNSEIVNLASGTDVMLRSTSNLLDVTLEPRYPSTKSLDVTMANTGPHGNVHLLHVEGAFTVGITDFPERPSAALSKAKLTSFEGAIWNFYASASQTSPSQTTKQ